MSKFLFVLFSSVLLFSSFQEVSAQGFPETVLVSSGADYVGIVHSPNGLPTCKRLTGNKESVPVGYVSLGEGYYEVWVADKDFPVKPGFYGLYNGSGTLIVNIHKF